MLEALKLVGDTSSILLCSVVFLNLIYISNWEKHIYTSTVHTIHSWAPFGSTHLNSLFNGWWLSVWTGRTNIQIEFYIEKFKKNWKYLTILSFWSTDQHTWILCPPDGVVCGLGGQIRKCWRHSPPRPRQRSKNSTKTSIKGRKTQTWPF